MPNASSTKSQRSAIPFPAHSLLSGLISSLLVTPLLLIPPTSPLLRPSPVFRSFALLAGIPPLWVVAVLPRLPLPSTSTSTSSFSSPNSPHARFSALLATLAQVDYKHALWVLITLLAIFLPMESLRVLEKTAVWGVLVLGYSVPGIVHGVLHALRAPLAILVPGPAGPGVGSENEDGMENGGHEESSSDLDARALLRRKERALQRKRLGKRIGWDLAVWIVLLPLGGLMAVWSAGRLVGIW
jgi:hypothetical protein